MLVEENILLGLSGFTAAVYFLAVLYMIRICVRLHRAIEGCENRVVMTRKRNFTYALAFTLIARIGILSALLVQISSDSMIEEIIVAASVLGIVAEWLFFSIKLILCAIWIFASSPFRPNRSHFVGVCCGVSLSLLAVYCVVVPGFGISYIAVRRTPCGPQFNAWLQTLFVWRFAYNFTFSFLSFVVAVAVSVSGYRIIRVLKSSAAIAQESCATATEESLRRQGRALTSLAVVLVASFALRTLYEVFAVIYLHLYVEEPCPQVKLYTMPVVVWIVGLPVFLVSELLPSLVTGRFLWMHVARELREEEAKITRESFSTL